MPKKLQINPEALRRLIYHVINKCEGQPIVDESRVDLMSKAFPKEEVPDWKPKEGEECYFFNPTDLSIKKMKFQEQWINEVQYGVWQETLAKAEAFKTAYLEFVKSYKNKV
jgi:hypothetical protein